MAWNVAPNTTVYLLRDVPCENDYTHTFFFPRAGVTPQNVDSFRNAQAQTFLSYKPYGKYEFTNQTYQREELGVIRLNINRDEIYDVNYMMFNNINYGNRWFYAFVDKLEYVNDNCTKIHYSLDMLQTWYYDFKINECFVVREHTPTDKIGDNIVPEEFSKGTYITNNKVKIPYFNALSLVIAAPFKIQYEQSPTPPYVYTVSISDFDGGFVGTMPSGICYSAFAMTDINGDIIPSFIEVYKDLITKLLHGQYSAQVDKIVSMFVFPTALIPQISDIEPHDIPMTQITYPFPVSNTTVLDGYTPKCNKMYTYPYTALMLSNENGESQTYKYEEFIPRTIGQSDYAVFAVYGSVLGSPSAQCVPFNYKGETNNYGCSLINSDYPMLTWNYGIYDVWIRQNYNSLNLKGVSNALTILNSGIAFGSAFAGGVGVQNLYKTGLLTEKEAAKGIAKAESLKSSGRSGIIGSIQNLATIFAQGEDIKAQGNNPQANGSASILSLIKANGIYFKQICMRHDFLEIIDDFFNAYGYAIKRFKIPNLFDSNGVPRPVWNYIKTENCIVDAWLNNCVPAETEEQIAAIFDRGVTFWTPTATKIGDVTPTPVEPGAYSLYDNSPTP